MSEEQMKALGYQVIDYIVEHRSRLKNQRVYNKSSYEELLPLIPDKLPLQGDDPQEVFEQLHHLLSHHIVHTDHPRFFSFIPAPSSYLSVLADTLATGYNVFAGHWMAGSSAAMIETTTLKWLCHLFNFPKEGEAFL